MKKISLLVTLFCIVFTSTKAQTWTAVPGYQVSYNDVIGVTKHQGDLWVLTKSGIYRVVGPSWQLTSPTFSVATSIGCIYSDGVDLYAGSLFNFGSYQALVIKWDGTQWMPIGYTDNTASGVWVATILKAPSNKLYAGGFFNNIGTSPSLLNNIRFLVTFDGTSWTQPYPFTDLSCTSGIYSVQSIGDSIYVAGFLSEVSGVWTPATFRFKEAGGMSALGGYGFCQLGRNYQMFQGVLHIGGTRQSDYSSANTGLTKWNGSNWVTVSNSMQLINTKVTKLLGQMYIAGVPNGTGVNGIQTNICSYDGANLTNEGVGISYPSGSIYPTINCMFADTLSNKLYVGGDFLQSNGNVADNFAVKSFSIVPVHLSLFTAQMISNGSVLLNWRDESPEDNVKFEVQVSNDSRSFRNVGEVTEQGGKKDYSFVYPTTECGKLFFRLHFENDYSKTVPLNIPCLGPKIIAGKQSLSIDTKLSGTLILTNLYGQTVLRTVLTTGVSRVSIGVPIGIYFARFIDKNGGIYIQKVLVE